MWNSVLKKSELCTSESNGRELLNSVFKGEMCNSEYLERDLRKSAFHGGEGGRGRDNCLTMYVEEELFDTVVRGNV